MLIMIMYPSPTHHETVVIVLRPTEVPFESEISSYANLGSENLISETDRLNSGGKPDMSNDNGSLFFHTDFS